jgi:adenosylmethionine-8-amino-7-oxononanoate aminotransferase
MDGTTQLLETDRQFLVHPLHHPDDHKAPLFIDQGKGAVLYDATGRSVVDGLSGLWNVNIGHGRGELADAAAAHAGVSPRLTVPEKDAPTDGQSF